MEALLTMLLPERFSALATDASQTKRQPEAITLREQILKDMEKKKQRKWDADLFSLFSARKASALVRVLIVLFQ